MKKIIAFLCLITVTFSTLSFTFLVNAADNTQNIDVKSVDSDVVESVIITGAEIYVDAHFLNRHTNYTVIEYNNGIRFKKGTRYINASFDGVTTINNNTVSLKLGNCKKTNNKTYYSLSNVLAILDSYIAVEDGKLIISNDAVTVWDLFNTFDSNSVKFDLSTEYSKDTKSESELSNGFVFQKLAYLNSNFKLVWSNATTIDMIKNLIDYDTSYNLCLDLMNDFDAVYESAQLVADAGNVSSVFDVINASESEKLATEFGATGDDAEFVTAYNKSNSDKIDLIKSLFDLNNDNDIDKNESKKAALNIVDAFSKVDDISGKIQNNTAKEDFNYFVKNNSPIESEKTSYKTEMEKLNLYLVLSELGLNKYIKYSNSVALSDDEGKEARLAAIEYIYFAKKAYETMQLYYENAGQKTVASNYTEKIEICNKKLAEFFAAGSAELCNGAFKVSDYEKILSDVAVTNLNVDDSMQGNIEYKAEQLLSTFIDCCTCLDDDQISFVGNSATKGQIGAVIFCVLSNKDYFMLSPENVEIVKSTKDQFNKIFDAVSNTYIETDIERCKSEEILKIIKDKFNIDLVLNKYDVYQYIYYEEGYFYNYHDAFIKENDTISDTFEIKSVKDINDKYTLVKFTKTRYNKNTDKSKTYNGYAVINLKTKAIYEYDETRSDISKSRLTFYK